MSEKYNNQDVLDELNLIQPESISYDGTGQISAERTLKNVKGSIARIITSDPDSLFAFMGVLSKQIVATSQAIINDCSSIQTLLGPSVRQDTRINESLLSEVLSSVEELSEGSLYERYNNYPKIIVKLRRLAASVTNQASTRSNVVQRDRTESRQLLNNAFSRLATNLILLPTLHTAFVEAINSYINSSLILEAVDTQADLVRQRINNFTGSSGVNVTRVVLAAYVGSAVLGERLTIRKWAASKYRDEVTIADGTPAYAESTISLPFNFPSLSITNLTVDGDSGTLNIVPSTTPTVRTFIPQYTEDGLQVLDRFAPQWPDPVADASFAMLVRNTIVNVTIPAAAFTSPSDMATALDSALTAHSVNVSHSSGYLTFSLTGASSAGSRGRIAFLNASDTTGGKVSINTTFGLTFTNYGETYGTDIDLTKKTNNITLGGLSTSPALSYNEIEVYNGSAVPGTSGGASTLTVTAGHTIEVGDSVLVDNSCYKVAVVADTEITLEDEILYDFNGATINSAVTKSFSVHRKRLRITSSSAVWGTTSISVTTPNDPGFPEVAQSPNGVHDSFSLNASPNIGSPIRIRDGVYDEQTNVLLGYITAVKGSTIKVGLLSGKELTSSIYIRSIGYISYQKLESENLQRVTNILDDLDTAESLGKKIDVFLASGQNRVNVDTSLSHLILSITEVKNYYSEFAPNITNAVVQFFKYLRESRLLIVYELLRTCSFYEIGELTTSDLSELGSIIAASDSILTSVAADDEVFSYRVTPDGPYDRRPSESSGRERNNNLGGDS